MDVDTTDETVLIPDDCAESDLEQTALDWLNEQGENYDNGAAGAYSDLMYGGCQSGIVSELIYYADTLAFYERHKGDISQLLQDLLEDTGLAVHELFGDKWDSSDPLANHTDNQNLLAWFGFEEAARRVADRAGIDY